MIQIRINGDSAKREKFRKVIVLTSQPIKGIAWISRDLCTRNFMRTRIFIYVILDKFLKISDFGSKTVFLTLLYSLTYKLWYFYRKINYYESIFTPAQCVYSSKCHFGAYFQCQIPYA